MLRNAAPKTAADIQGAIQAQADVCTRLRIPRFAPSNGICWSCRRQIYEELDGTHHVSGCPFCHRSYCD
jgi:hypothetical protein